MGQNGREYVTRAAGQNGRVYVTVLTVSADSQFLIILLLESIGVGMFFQNC